MAEAALALGKIEGLCAVTDTPTLNGRSYNEIYKRIMQGADYREDLCQR